MLAFPHNQDTPAAPLSLVHQAANAHSKVLYRSMARQRKQGLVCLKGASHQAPHAVPSSPVYPTIHVHSMRALEPDGEPVLAGQAEQEESNVAADDVE